MDFGLEFDGKTGLRLQPGNILPSLRGLSSLTVFARIRPFPSVVDGQRSIIELSTSSVPGLFMGINGGFLQVGARSQPSDAYLTYVSPYLVKNGEWHSVIGVFDFGANTVRVGLDGELSPAFPLVFGASSVSPSPKPSGFDFIGMGVDGTSRAFTGAIGDISIWSRPFGQAEFSRLHYEGIRPDKLDGTPPAYYWPLDTQGQANPRSSGSVGIPSRVLPLADNPPSVPSLVPISEPEFRFSGTRVMRINGELASAGRVDGTPIGDVLVKGAGIKALQPNTAIRPDFKIIAGKKAIQFASGDYLQAATGDIDTAQGVSVVCLMNNRNSGRVFSISSSSSVETNGVFFQAVTGLATTDATPVASYSTYGDYTNGSVAIFSGRFSGAETVNWLNGVKRNGTVTNGSERSDGSFKPTVAPAAAPHQQLQIGRRLHSTLPSYWDGDLYDMIIVEGAVTDEEIRFLEGVVAWQNGRTDLLPVSHAWRSVQPEFSSPISYIWGDVSSVVSRSKSPVTLYAGGPGLIRGSDGTLLCCYDYFGTHAEQGNSFLSVSTDNGNSWSVRTSFPNAIWPTVFNHTDGNLYLLSMNSSTGNIEIRKSMDLGFSWCSPTMLTSGSPLPSPGSGQTAPNYHRASGLQPCYHDGHIFFACENIDPHVLNSGFRVFSLYANASGNLLDPANWKASNQGVRGSIPFVDAEFGTLEGSVAVLNDQLFLVYRATGNYGAANVNKGVVWPLSWDGTTLTVSAWSSSYIRDIPGGQAKIPIVRYGDYFYIVSNQNVDVSQFQRNRSVLLRSSDLLNWTVHQVLVDQDSVEAASGMSESNSRSYHSFQYAGFFIESDGEYDVIHVSYRIAWSGADMWHNSNYVGYSRFLLS